MMILFLYVHSVSENSISAYSGVDAFFFFFLRDFFF